MRFMLRKESELCYKKGFPNKLWGSSRDLWSEPRGQFTPFFKGWKIQWLYCLKFGIFTLLLFLARCFLCIFSVFGLWEFTRECTQGFLRWNLVLRFFHRLFFEALIHIQKLVIWPNCFDKKCCIGSKVSINVEKNWVLLSLLSAKWPQKGVFLYSYALQWAKSYWYRCVQGDA